MNPKISEYKQAIALRETGLSYNEILRKVKVSRSTISLWLHDVPMSNRYRERNIDTNYKGLIRLVIRRSVDLTRKIRGWTNGIVFEDCLRSVGE